MEGLPSLATLGEHVKNFKPELCDIAAVPEGEGVNLLMLPSEARRDVLFVSKILFWLKIASAEYSEVGKLFNHLNKQGLELIQLDFAALRLGDIVRMMDMEGGILVAIVAEEGRLTYLPENRHVTHPVTSDIGLFGAFIPLEIRRYLHWAETFVPAD